MNDIYTGKECETIDGEQTENFMIEFADWILRLTPSEKVTVWSKDGQENGIFALDGEQLLRIFKRKKKADS